MKKRRFAGGGETEFSPEQEAWLGKADRTDPYILARMRRAVPDRVTQAPVEDRQFTPVFSPEQEAWLGKADRTDPYILARMRRAVPDRVTQAPVEDRQFTPVRQEAPAERSAASDTDIADMKRSASSASDEDDTASMKRSAVSVKASRPAAAPVRSKLYTGAGGSGRGMQGGPTADEMAAYSAQQKAKRLSDMVRMPTTDEIQTGLDTATSLIGAGGLGRMLAKKLMQRGATTAAPAALPAPTPRLRYDKAGAKAAERSARAEARQAEMLKENARRSGLTEDAPEATRTLLPMKKGGSVKKYAKGGSIDGCAQRGKTKGRYL